MVGIKVLSTILTVVVLFAVLFVSFLFIRKSRTEEINRVKNAMDAVIYNIFMFLFLTFYVLILMVRPDLNVLLSAALLVFLVWLASKISHKCIDKESMDIREKKLAVVVSVFGISIILAVLSIIEIEPEYWKYICAAFAIIVGFFVPLDVLVGEDSFKEALEKIKESFAFKKVRKAIIIIPLLTLGIIICIAFVVPRIISDELQDAINVGIAIGTIVFFVFIVVVTSNKKTRRLAEKLLKK